jgi:hypothetical protein
MFNAKKVFWGVPPPGGGVETFEEALPPHAIKAIHKMLATLVRAILLIFMMFFPSDFIRFQKTTSPSRN